MQVPPPGSTSVLPPTGRLSVVLVVANAGNAEISGYLGCRFCCARGTDTSCPGSFGRTRSTAVRVGRLAPGASIVITLPALAVSAGRSYTLWASVGRGLLPVGPVTAPPSGVGQTDQVRIRVASG